MVGGQDPAAGGEVGSGGVPGCLERVDPDEARQAHLRGGGGRAVRRRDARAESAESADRGALVGMGMRSVEDHRKKQDMAHAGTATLSAKAGAWPFFLRADKHCCSVALLSCGAKLLQT